MNSGASLNPESIAVVIPCYNEEKTIALVIKDAQRYLPEARIYLFDNESSDRSVEIATELEVSVFTVHSRGKGYVIRAILEKINENIIVMLDGDATYDLSQAKKLTTPVICGECDMAVGARLENHQTAAFRNLHVFGNNLVRWLINKLFNSNLTDVMSGYRAFTREVAKKIPIASKGFEVETEWTIQLLTQGYHLKEISLPYKSRIEGSYSKLNTFRDGFKVLWTIFKLFKDIKPLTFFGSFALCFYFPSCSIGYAIYKLGHENWGSDQIPLIVIATGMFLSGIFLTSLGILMNSAAEKHNQILSVIKKL